MLGLLLLYLWGAPTQKALEVGLTDAGYTQIRYDLDHHYQPIEVAIHPSLGCVLLFSRPYDDTWASDAKGKGLGAYYQYFEWGHEDGGPQKVIISNILKTEEPVNVFFLFGNRVLEILLKQVNDLEQADRMVSVRLVGQEAPKPEKPAPKTRDQDGQDRRLAALMTLLVQKDNHRKTIAHGEVIYNLDKPPFFVYFNPNTLSPEVQVFELIRGIKGARRQSFRFEYPVKPLERHRVGNRQFLVFPNFALADKERLYVRVQVLGERNAKVYRCRKNP